MTVFEAKQEWTRKVLAAKAPHAAKTFALCVASRAYGDKTVSFPDYRLIMLDGGFSSHGHFKKYRDFWVACGAWEAHKDYHTKKQTYKNYNYTLNLDWDGSVESHDSSGTRP